MRTRIFISLCLIYLLAATAQAATQPTPAEKAGATVVTPYFEVTIPNGWIMPYPVKKQPMDGVSTVFATDSGNPAVTINVMKAGMEAKVLAEQTAANMEKSGLKTSKPKESGGLWVVDISGPAKGQAWFGADGTYCSVITLLGTNYAVANDFLKHVKSKLKKLFPDIKS